MRTAVFLIVSFAVLALVPPVAADHAGCTEQTLRGYPYFTDCGAGPQPSHCAHRDDYTHGSTVIGPYGPEAVAAVFVTSECGAWWGEPDQREMRRVGACAGTLAGPAIVVACAAFDDREYVTGERVCLLILSGHLSITGPLSVTALPPPACDAVRAAFVLSGGFPHGHVLP